MSRKGRSFLILAACTFAMYIWASNGKNLILNSAFGSMEIDWEGTDNIMGHTFYKTGGGNTYYEEEADLADFVNVSGLYEYENGFTERIIDDGVADEGRIYVDFSEYYYSAGIEDRPVYMGLLASQDVALIAEETAGVLLSIMEKGGYAPEEQGYFGDDGYRKFCNMIQRELKPDWDVSPAYDC